jgi:ferredoxin
MMRFLKKLHKWIGLLIGLQVLLWVLSGLVISLLDPARVSGRQWADTTPHEPEPLPPGLLLEPGELPASQLADALSVSLMVSRGIPVYTIRHTAGDTLLSAVDGSVIVTGKADAEKLAKEDFTGDGDIIETTAGLAPGTETRDSSGPYWKVSFSDTAGTAIYISAASGEILERRNSFWRLRDFFWMLHIMDYTGREDFNNPLVITMALVALWLGISGFLLLFGSFSRHDFYFLNLAGKRAYAMVTLVGPALEKPCQVRLRKGSNLFLSLASHDIDLPSLCGGGGECGRCKVKMEAGQLPAENATERDLIPRQLRDKGYRLACQQRVENDITMHVPGGTSTDGR